RKKKKHQNISPLSPSLSSHLNESEENSSTVTKSEPVSVEPPVDAGEVKDLGGQLNSDLGSDLDEQLSPGTIEKTLEFPLDAAELAHQASKLLEEHDFTEVLNKIPDEAFTELFAESKNGEYVPSREETEELERALAAVSKDVRMAKESLAKLSGTGRELGGLHNNLLESDNLVVSVNENSFHELAHSGLDNLSVITSTLSSDLTSLSEDLSTMAQGHMSHPSLVSESHLLHNSLLTLQSDLSHSSSINGYYLGQNRIQSDGLATLWCFDGGVISYSAVDPGIIAQWTVAFLMGLLALVSGDETVVSVDHTPPEWFLPCSESFSHPANQNGFCISSTANGQVLPSVQQLLTTIGKYPLHTLSTEVSVVSSPSSLSTPAVLSEKIADGDHIQTMCVTGSSNVLTENPGTAIKQGGVS
ncbi:uncharacterized protein LOC143242368, partial [Tachypleus tridentatus]|uniref:uncharacterized protein LOC143242368 n=1 Tax=Tachypleus tridentatus TaxID=6853 RepID=UPI003FCFA2BF